MWQRVEIPAHSSCFLNCWNLCQRKYPHTYRVWWLELFWRSYPTESHCLMPHPVVQYNYRTPSRALERNEKMGWIGGWYAFPDRNVSEWLGKRMFIHLCSKQRALLASISIWNSNSKEVWISSDVTMPRALTLKPYYISIGWHVG